MSLLTSLTKKASGVSNLAKGLAGKASPVVNKGANKTVDFMGLRGMTDQFGSSIAKATAPKGTSQFVTSPKASDVYKSAAMGATNFIPVGKILQGAKLGVGVLKNSLKGADNVSSGFPSSSKNFAENLANVNTAYAGKTGSGATIPVRNPPPIKSGSVDQRTFSDIRPNTGNKITTKTTTARNSTLDTRATPTKSNTVRTSPNNDIDMRFPGSTLTKTVANNVDNVPGKTRPWAKAGIGLGAAALGANYMYGGDSGQPTPNQSLASETDLANAQSKSQQNVSANSSLSPDNAFGNNEGGVFESPTPAPQTGTGMGGSFQPGFSSFGQSNGMGISGFGSSATGSGGGQYKADTNSYIDEDDDKKYRYENKERRDEYNAEREAFKEYAKSFGTKENRQEYNQQNKQIQDYNKRIAGLTNNQASYDIDLETSAASSSAREGLAGMLDRETRKSLIPLQTSLALVQAERDRADKLRQQEIENQQAMKGPEDNSFTLGAGQTRFALNPATGQYEQIGSVASNPQSTPSTPTSIQEYEYARQQGYQGTYNDFQQQSNSQNTTDKILSPYEAASLGVPYGTTQSQAYGVNPSKLSGDAAKVQAIASTMIPEINALKARFTQNYKGALTGYLTGTDRELVKLVDQVADKVGRLRSGGAVNADEEERFKRQIASFMDLPFGNSTQAIQALDGLINEAQQVSSSIDPYYQGGQQPSYNGGSSWSW